ncbi:hypothetical protein F8388_009613 [Cannabis sativa]|uniref:Dof zinc finger protein n=1 Tax=Cannabis sativa TaxID=3483 RepID=A0A7J6E8D6_CANSA|nr:hypothetical protein F8388_009613 [Cannabis sativa]
MDPSTGQNLQEMSSSDSLGNILVGSKQQSQHQDQRKQTSKPHPEQALKCPRCDSTNTKFCYYNNYSLTQPRYFCKACRRYWTKGGTLRNVPVGGGCRRNKRSSSNNNNNNSSSSSTATSSATSSSKLIKPSHHHNSLLLLPQQLSVIGGSNSSSGYDSNDLSLAFARLQKQSSCGQLLGNFDHGYDHNHNNNELIGINNSNIGFLDALRNGMAEIDHTAGRESWNGLSSSWHGFLNTTPLM